MRLNWRRRDVCGALLMGGAAALAARGAPAVAATAAGRPQLLLYQANLSARTPSLLANADFVDSLPFTGVTLNIPASWAVMQPGVRLDYDDIYGPWLAPLRGRLRRVTRNFVLAVVRKAADPFDDWSVVIANWRALAQAARDAGLAGIVFDNEPYFERLWNWPGDVDYKQPLAAYQRQYRQRGRELMTALREVWPEIVLVVLHGPYLSEPRTPVSITLDQARGVANDLSGHFFVGLAQGTDDPATLVDGGEVYQYRTPQDFAASYAWRKRQMPQLPTSGTALIPEGVRGRWADRVSIGFGAYDLTWRRDYPMSADTLRSTLTNALARADDLVWLFTEGGGPHDYLVPGGVGGEWLDAVAGAASSGAASSRRVSRPR